MLGMKYTEAKVSSVEKFITDPVYALAQKLDGTRVMAHVTRSDDGDRVDFLGAGGNAISFAAAKQHFGRLRDRLLESNLPTSVIDGELLLDGSYHAFDLPYQRGVVTPETPFWERMMVLEGMGILNVAPTAMGEDAKRVLWNAIVASNAEGAIVRPVGSTYEIGRRSNQVQKLKIVKTADVVVKNFRRDRNAAGRETGAATLGVYDENGNLKTVGACSLIGKPQVAVGDVIEVAFLYATSGLVLYQPRMLRVRQDKEPVECTIDQVRQWVTSKAVITLHA